MEQQCQIAVIEHTIQIAQIKVRFSQICGKFNTEWKEEDNSIDSNNEKVASYLCYRGAWTSYLDSSVASYAIGSPSAEMYIDAWNQFKGEKKLDYKWVASGTALYSSTAGVNGYAYAPGYGSTSITDFRSYTANHVLTTEANSMFMTSENKWWLASPSCYTAYGVCVVNGDSSSEFLSGSYGNAYGVCPLVSLGS